MPRLWDTTIDAHRRAVIDAILDATAALVDRQGLASVKMSQIAEESGIGRATLYKYFADVETILIAWHERRVAAHLAQLIEVRDRAGSATERLEAVLQAYAFMSQHQSSQTAAALHRGQHVGRAHATLHRLVSDLIAEGAKTDRLRTDTPPEELATYCIHALGAAADLPSPTAVRRLVAVTVSGLRG